MPKGLSALTLSGIIERAGRTPSDPSFDATRLVKTWIDTGSVALKAAEANGDEFVVYDRVFDHFGPEEKPIFKRMFMPPVEARSYNFADSGSNAPGTNVASRPVPLRELADDEILKPAMGGIPQLWTASELAATTAVPFTGEIADLIRRIAKKLGA